MRSFSATNMTKFVDYWELKSPRNHGPEQAEWNAGVILNKRPFFDEGRGNGRTTSTVNVDIAKDTRYNSDYY